MPGYFVLRRGWSDHPAFSSARLCRPAAWCWMIEAACYAPTKVNVGGRTLQLQRGQFSHSIRFMAAAWRWDKAAVSRFIERLRTETLIETATETGQLVVTICNYDEMQSQVAATETTGEKVAETVLRRRRGKEERRKQSNAVEILDSYDADFTEWWTAYPLKVGKSAVAPVYRKACCKVGSEALLAGLEAYKRAKPAWQEWVGPQRWLREERWADRPAAESVAHSPVFDPLAKARRAAEDVLHGKRYLRATLAPSDYRQGIAAGLFTAEQAKAAGATI